MKDKLIHILCDTIKVVKINGKNGYRIYSLNNNPIVYKVYKHNKSYINKCMELQVQFDMILDKVILCSIQEKELLEFTYTVYDLKGVLNIEIGELYEKEKN